MVSSLSIFVAFMLYIFGQEYLKLQKKKNYLIKLQNICRKLHNHCYGLAIESTFNVIISLKEVHLICFSVNFTNSKYFRSINCIRTYTFI